MSASNFVKLEETDKSSISASERARSERHGHGTVPYKAFRRPPSKALTKHEQTGTQILLSRRPLFKRLLHANSHLCSCPFAIVLIFVSVFTGNKVVEGSRFAFAALIRFSLVQSPL